MVLYFCCYLDNKRLILSYNGYIYSKRGMILKIRKIAVLSIALLTIIICTPSILCASALTVEPAIPTYGLYCENLELIKGGSTYFNFSNDELFSEGKCNKQAEYCVSATDHEVEFAIPFVSSALNMPEIAVSVNGQKVEGTVWYGYSGFWADYEFDIGKTYSPVLDESVIGTLYTFVPDSDIVTISLKLNEWKSYIYETTNHYSSSNSADGSHTWTLKNASSLHEYSFFIFGDPSECTFESSCGYKMQTITCKEFIDSQYEIFEEYYAHNGNVTIELFYSAVNRVIQEKTIISYDELFLRSLDTYRVNAYKFQVSLQSDSVISYELPVNIQINYGYKPYVYYVEQRHVGSYPVTYSIKMRDDVPYIIESSNMIENSTGMYTAETAEDFGFYFSASKKPIEIQSPKQPGLSKTQLIICIVCGIVGGIALILLGASIYFIVRDKKKMK